MVQNKEMGFGVVSVYTSLVCGEVHVYDISSALETKYQHLICTEHLHEKLAVSVAL